MAKMAKCGRAFRYSLIYAIVCCFLVRGAIGTSSREGQKGRMSTSARNIAQQPAYVASCWTAEQVAQIAQLPLPEAPVIGPDDVRPILAGHDLWDVWPLQAPDGGIAEIAGGQLWMILSAPAMEDPGLRHDIARTRLLFRRDGEWTDCGLLFPDDLNPGSREWSGAARYDVASNCVTAWFTAAGRRGEASSFEQRLFQTRGSLDLSGDLPRITGWNEARPLVTNDGCFYVDLRVDQGVPGNIRGFRDPYWLRDPADGEAYVLFTGSQAGSVHMQNGVVGFARAPARDDDAGYELLLPIISADGVCNELERPHVVIRNGLYYVFWSSQSSVFAPNGPTGPSGLYGMVAPSLTGPYEPLNETGLVICNPVAEPRQAYCWQVLDTLEVISFVDHWGLQGRDILAEPALQREQFGGTIAPMLRIELDGNRSRLLGLA
jgi:levansucrase